jgi:hypothetical protein
VAREVGHVRAVLLDRALGDAGLAAVVEDHGNFRDPADEFAHDVHLVWFTLISK